MKPVYVSFFTEGTFYEDVVKDLVVSLKKFNLDHKVYCQPDLGNWDENCRQKPLVIKKALEEFSQPIVWLDADAIIQQNPVWLDSLDCDFSCHVRRLGGFSIFGATLYFGNTSVAKNLVENWSVRCQRGEKELPLKLPPPYYQISTVWSYADQGPLSNAYWSFILEGRQISFQEMPKSYAVKYNSKHSERIIVQNQVSRFYKEKTKDWKSK